MHFLERRHSDTESDWARELYEQFIREVPCPTCKGARLRPVEPAETVGGRSIAEVADMAVGDALAFHQELDLRSREAAVADEELGETRWRLGLRSDVGLE